MLDRLKRFFRPLSPDNLRKSVSFHRFESEPIDPNRERVFQYIQTHKNDLRKAIQDSQDFWDGLFECRKKFPQKTHIYEIEVDGFLFEISVFFDDTSVVRGIDKSWADAREQRVGEIFSSEYRLDSHDPYSPYLPDGLAEFLRIQPLHHFLPGQFDRVPNLAKIKDLQGFEIDGNIMELIHLFNGIGIKTDGSCGGHSQRKQKPYVSFPGDQLEKVLPVIQAWERAGGKKYGIRPLGKYAESFLLETLPDVSLAESVSDIDAFTVFLGEKIGEIPYHKVALPEWIHRFRRRVKRSMDWR